MSKHKKAKVITPMDGEIWKPIEEFPPFEVSNFGRIRNSENFFEKKINIDQNGNPVARFTKNHQTKTRGLAKMVGDAFIPHSHKMTQPSFKDGNKLNCRADNIEYIPAKGLEAMNRQPRAVVCVESGEIFASLSEVSKELDISVTWLSRATDHSDRSCGGLHWRTATPDEVKIIQFEDKLAV